MRRQLTKKTKLFEKLTQSYFTHVGVYYNEGKIIEAVGKENDPKDEVLVSNLLETDWVKTSAEKWVIFRPQNVEYYQLSNTLENMKEMAENLDYRFGLNWGNVENSQLTSCAEFIFREYSKTGIIRDAGYPKIITPDYLFWYFTNNPDRFLVVGHN